MLSITDNRLRVYPPKSSGRQAFSGENCLVISIHRNLEHATSHPTFTSLINRLAESEGVLLEVGKEIYD